MSLMDKLDAALAGPTREQLDALGFTDIPAGPRQPCTEALALAVCDWLRERGESHRYDGEDTAVAWVHLFVGEICDEIALRSNLPAQYAEAAQAARRGSAGGNADVATGVVNGRG